MIDRVISRPKDTDVGRVILHEPVLLASLLSFQFVIMARFSISTITNPRNLYYSHLTISNFDQLTTPPTWHCGNGVIIAQRTELVVPVAANDY